MKDQGFIAKPTHNPNGTLNLTIWECAIPGPIKELCVCHSWTMKGNGQQPQTSISQVLLQIQQILNNPDIGNNGKAYKLYCENWLEYERKASV